MSTAARRPVLHPVTPPAPQAAPEPKRERAVIALLAGILALVLIGQAAVSILNALPPRIRYVSEEAVYVQGVALEWRLHMTVHGEPVTASFFSERELIRVTDELGHRPK